MIRIAINGYGRIGRCLLHALFESARDDQFEIVAINDLADFSLIAHLTQFDSTHGAFNADVQLAGDKLLINNHPILLLHEPAPEQLPWKALDIDLVVECSGRYTQRSELEQHLAAGAPAVLASCPIEDADLTVAYGINHEQLTGNHRIVSNASCTTNCLAPLVKVLNDAIGIESGIMTTIHAYTNDQHLLDGALSDPYRARAATLSMIPTKTGAADAVAEVIPELAGKITGMAVRVPTHNVSVVDFHFQAKRETSVEEVNALFKQASEQSLSQVLSYNQLPLVSVDFNHNPASCIFDATQTTVLGKQVKVMSWYDNEWGFANRLLDVAALMAQA